MYRLVEALHSGRVLLMDGAMGTELQRLGMRDDECSAMWNLTHPEQVAAVHAAYLEAGAEVLLSNTFMANTAALTRYGLDNRRAEIWRAAMELACMFRNPAPIVLADAGPFADAQLRHERTLGDGVLLETWSCTTDARPVPPLVGMDTVFNVPALISFTFCRAPGAVVPRTREGASPEDCVLASYEAYIHGLGANCGSEVDMDDLLAIVRVYRECTDLPIFIRPNAGTPTRTASGWEYPRSPEYMADKLWPLLEAGVTMVGGCCGTTPAHIAAFRRVVDEWNAKK